MKTIKTSYNTSKLDVLNAASSIAFKDVPPTEKITVSGCAIVTEDTDDGQRDFAYIFDNEAQKVYGGNSAAAVDLLSGLIPIMEEEPGTYTVTVSCQKSKGGKDYLTFHTVFEG